MTTKTFTTVSLLLASWLAFTPIIAYADMDAHLVISETQIAGQTVTDEFIELYNPTENSISLLDFKLQKRTATGTSSNLVTNFPNITVAPHGYFLVAHPTGYTNQTIPDLRYSTTNSLAENNTVVLLDATGQVIDLLGFGAATQFETNAAPNPPAGSSLERLPGNNLGNGTDTDSNLNDFVFQPMPNPNSSVTAPMSPFPLVEISPLIKETEQSAPETVEPDATTSDSTTAETAQPIDQATTNNETNLTTDTSALTNTDTNEQTNLMDPLVSSRQVGTSPEDDTRQNIAPSARAPIAGDLIINELMPNPETADEWVEIKNVSADELALGNLSVKDDGNHSIVINGTISAGEYRLFYFSSSILNNSGDAVRLLGADDSLLDELSYGNWQNGNLNAAAPAKGQSLARASDKFSGSLNNDFKLTTTPTPGASNIITAPAVKTAASSKTATQKAVASAAVEAETERKNIPQSFAPGSLIISELYPYPYPSEDEWIEIYNPSDQTIDLTGWSLSDDRNTRTPISGSIAGKNYFVIEHPRGHLNNDGDTVTLFDPSENKISTAVYTNAERGQSIAWADNEWSNTIAPSAGQANVIEAAEDKNKTVATKTACPSSSKSKTTNSKNKVYKVTLSEARELEKGSLVETKGVVSMPLGVAGTRTFYLAGSGMQIYLHGIDIPNLKIGDTVELQGKLGSTGGETRITVSKSALLKITGHSSPPVPESIEIGSIDDSTEGWLVQVEGTLSEKLNDRWTVEDSSGSIPVILKSGAIVDRRKAESGDSIKIVGIVSQTQSGYRLLPRSNDDISLLSKAAATNPPRTNFHFSMLTVLAGALVAALLAMLVRKQYLALQKQKLEVAVQDV